MRDSFYQMATPDQIARFASAKGLTDEVAASRLADAREKMLEKKRGDPFRHGYEPEVWYVARALLRGYRPSPGEVDYVKRRISMSWGEYCERMRHVLGFRNGVGELIVMGANRSGKTDFMAKTANRIAFEGGKTINIGFQSLPTGKQVQEPRVWNYLPRELKKTVKTAEEYIAYTKQNGFSGSKITFRNGSAVRFITYEMDVNSVMEGSALDFCALDEEFPKSFLDAARFRLASKRGILLCTFTPVSGFTPVVADFLNGMVVTKERTAWMLPIDGKPALPYMELGLSEIEYEKLKAWRDSGGLDDPGVPEARPEPCLNWVLGDTIGGQHPGGRLFEKTPRVAVCKDGEAAAIWFYGSDNPYGMPGEVIQAAMKNINARREIKKRVYGMAERIKGRMFPEFTRSKNVCRVEDMPKSLVRCMVVDPAPERNWTAGWYGYDPVCDVLYKYRDWPGNYEIPGVGVPGPWAVQSDRRNGINDGDRGEAQESFGMGFLAYKYEWARLERWADFVRWVESGHDEMSWPDDWDEIDGWSEVDGVAEQMLFRVIDARAASQSKISRCENVSLFEEVSRLAEGFQPASGQQIGVGLNMLRDRIAVGKYRICDCCTNTIFAYENFTGADGQKGACKDFLDCDRYVILSGICDTSADDATVVGRSVGDGAAPRGPSGRPRIRAGGR